MRIRSMVIAAMFVAAGAMAQESSELRKLDWLVGEWKGEGWSRVGPGEPRKAMQTEIVQKKAGGDVLLVEGLGRDETGKVVHDAIGLIWYDAKSKQIRFNAAAAGRGMHDTILEVGDGFWLWRSATPMGETRFTVRRTEKGEWHEVGEFTRDKGATWMKFMEMTLTRVK
jgi:hypothetical protein